LASIEKSLHTLTTKVDMWGVEILAALQEGTFGSTKQTINTYLGYEEKWGTPIPDYEDHYVPAASRLHLTATDTAAQAPFVGPTTAYAGNDPVVVLDTWKASGAMSYLDWYARTNYGLPGPPVNAPANPAVWTTAARAFAMLEAQNPQYARLVSPQLASAVT